MQWQAEYSKLELYKFVINLRHGVILRHSRDGLWLADFCPSIIAWLLHSAYSCSAASALLLNSGKASKTKDLTRPGKIENNTFKNHNL